MPPDNAVPPVPQRPDAEDLPTRPDRRRPGRLSIVNPHLISLLRRPATALSQPDLAPLRDATEAADDLGAARGILFAVALGILLWVIAAGFILLAFLRHHPP